MARETSRSQATPSQGARGGARGAPTSAKATAELKLDQLFADMEERARGYLKSIENWVNQGDDLLTRSKAWLDQHPVALAMANKYSSRVPNMPHSTEEAKETLRSVGNKVSATARRRMESARANPIETALIGGAVGVLAWVTLRGGRAQA